MYKKYSNISEILRDYYKYLTDKVESYEKAESYLDKYDNGDWKVSGDHVSQYKFMRSIFPKERWHDDVYYGSSSGRPWTQMKVLRIEDGDKYNLFWRIDTNVNGPYIALRYYDAYNKKSDSEKKDHVDIYYKLRSLLECIINNNKKTALSWDEVRGNRYTGNYTETTLIIISLKDYLEGRKKLNKLFADIENLTDELVGKIY